jgi:hypothetical protein
MRIKHRAFKGERSCKIPPDAKPDTIESGWGPATTHQPMTNFHPIQPFGERFPLGFDERWWKMGRTQLSNSIIAMRRPARTMVMMRQTASWWL